MAKWWCTELQKRVVDRCLQLLRRLRLHARVPDRPGLRRRPHHHDLRRHDRDHEGDHRPGDGPVSAASRSGPAPGQPWAGDPGLVAARRPARAGTACGSPTTSCRSRATSVEPIQECWTVLAGLGRGGAPRPAGSIVTGNTYRSPCGAGQAEWPPSTRSPADASSSASARRGRRASTSPTASPYPSTRGRLDRLDEACAVITSLLREDRSSFAGHHYRCSTRRCRPSPCAGHLPLMVGGVASGGRCASRPGGPTSGTSGARRS